MAFKCLAILALTTAVAHAAVVAPQQQAASQQFAYLLPQQPAQGYQQAYYYTPVALGQASSDVSVVDGQQQQQQQRQQLAFRAGETQAAQSASARLFLDFTSQITAINTAVQQLLNKGDPILVRADLYRSGDAAGANPVGWALLYQKSATSNIQMFVNIQYVGALTAAEITPGAAGDWNTVRIRQASTLGGAAARCNVATAPTLGTDVATITMTATANARPVTAADNNLNAIIGTASIAPATATLFGTNSIINKNLRIAGSANLVSDDVNTFCGIINTVVV